MMFESAQLNDRVNIKNPPIIWRKLLFYNRLFLKYKLKFTRTSSEVINKIIGILSLRKLKGVLASQNTLSKISFIARTLTIFRIKEIRAGTIKILLILLLKIIITTVNTKAKIKYGVIKYGIKFKACNPEVEAKKITNKNKFTTNCFILKIRITWNVLTIISLVTKISFTPAILSSPRFNIKCRFCCS